MEPAGLAVGLLGLAGLFNTCLEVVNKYDSWKGFGADLRSLTAQFETQKIRLERWGEVVGIQLDGLSDQHHELLDDPLILSNVKDVLLSIKDTCGLESNVGPTTASGKHDHTGAPRGLRRQRLNWALRNKEKWIAQVAQFSSMVDGLHNMVPVERGSGLSHVLTDQAPWLLDIKQVLAGIEQEKEVERRRDIRAWLLGDHRQSEIYEVYVNRSVQGSCEWVLDRPWFREWSSSDFPSGSAKYLWINGPAGFGKSILCAKVIQHLIVSLDTPVAYFLCDSETRDPFVAVRFWLFQLLSRQRVFAIVRGKWETTEAQSATRGDIFILLQEIVSTVPGCTLVLDGLDECDFAKGSWPGSADDSIPKFLESLRQATTGTSTRLLIMSRNEPEIRYGLLDGGPDDDVYEHQITPDDVRDDVVAYSRSVVNEKLSKKPGSIKDGITQRLAKGCNGQFLWVRLQKETLRSGKSERQLQEAISSTPPGIEHFYERNWKKIMNLPDADRARAFSILHWTSFSVRPLTVSEISGALVVGDDSEELQLDDVPDSIDEDYVSTEITELCGSLLELRDPQGNGDPRYKTLHLTHFSVKEYLLRNIPTQRRVLQLNASLTQSTDAIESMVLARKCLRFVNCKEAWPGTVTLEAEGVLGAFRAYAAGSWYQKAMLRDISDSELVNCINRLFNPLNPNWTPWKTWFDLNFYREQSQPTPRGAETASPLCYAARLGLEKTVKYLIREVKCDVDSRGYYGETPLVAASTEGDLEIVTALLEQGADPSLADMDGQTPLNLASYYGHTEVVKLLIEFDAEVNIDTNHGQSPNNIVNISHRGGWTPIYSAAYMGHTEVVRALLQYGADINTACYDGWRPIIAAAEHGRIEVVKILLQHGADVNIATNNGWTPINAAASRGHTEVANLLLDYGANVDTPDSTGTTPLVAALLANNSDMAKLLLYWGADSTVKDSFGRTPVMYASWNGDPQIMELLQQNGANPADASETGETALHFAAYAGRIKSAEILLRSSLVNVDALDRANRTPLFTAASRGHLSMVDTLLSHNANPNHTDSYGSMPLSVAVRNGRVDVVKQLIMLTEDPVNRKDGFGRTLLWWASKVGETKIMEILRDWARDNGIKSDDIDFSVETSTLPLAEPDIKKICDVCTRDILTDDPYHSCETCFDFDVCVECFEMGMRCLSSSHQWTYHQSEGQV
ncbi:uncharacterized protein APUU_80465S [Aspergillus puulaauensis]|uniref:Ankyrin repeat-containing domain protein n=1 Tax=Aspergillus puulaauensis TaxID=1220207 RepID=A0A7R8ATF8_9EURO|nr:uncharacterized protein APUU_80465S [Aspergillus puulaauensis]BCS30162.1 hypothetical protein APUU_80465S [Aspergillus puulaauensis]